jgi:hypothetical protein
MSRGPSLLVVLEEFAKQLADLELGRDQRRLAGGRRAIVAARGAARALLGRCQKAAFLEPVQNRVERAGAELVSVAC